MKILKKKNGIIIMSLTILLFSNFSIRALAAEMDTSKKNTTTIGTENTYEPDITEDADVTEETINYIAMTEPEYASEPVLTKPEHEETSYTEDVFFTQTTIKGILSSSVLYFYVPNYWDTKYVYAEIQYDISQLIEHLTSSITFSINDIPIESYHLEYKNGNSQILYVKIPLDRIRDGYNTLTISAYARIYNEEGCIDDYSGANWLSIDDTSYVRCGYESKDANHQIAYYPFPFVSTYNKTGEGLTIAVSDEATDGEMTAAMNLMADLSSKTTGKNAIQVCLYSDLEDTDPTRTIIISKYDNLPEQYQRLITKVPEDTKNAVVNYVDDEMGNPLFIITSQEDESLLEAVNMLMDEDRLSQEKSNYASVAEGSGLIKQNSTAQNDMIAKNYTLNDIMGSGLSYIGPFHQVKYVYLPISEDYVLSEAGKITLKFRYSENLDFTRSLITVYWGEIPIASKKLEKENASGDELTFDNPTDMIGTTAGSIKIAFDLEIQEMLCTHRQEEMPWAYISKESTIFLPASSSIELSFNHKPSPFRRDGEFNDAMMIISDQPSTNELNLFGQIIAMYGKNVEPYGKLIVRRVSEFDHDDADYNIITAGTYLNNTLITELNDALDFQYNNTGTKFVSNEQLILSNEFAGDIAIMQLLKSPYAINRGILAVTGINENTLLNVQKYLREDILRSTLTKDCVIIDSDLEIKAYKFINIIDNDLRPTMLEKFVLNKKSLIFTIVATSIMFMLLIAVIIILIRIRIHGKKYDRAPHDD